jgi:hypothetical protein
LRSTESIYIPRIFCGFVVAQTAEPVSIPAHFHPAFRADTDSAIRARHRNGILFAASRTGRNYNRASVTLRGWHLFSFPVVIAVLQGHHNGIESAVNFFDFLPQVQTRVETAQCLVKHLSRPSQIVKNVGFQIVLNNLPKGLGVIAVLDVNDSKGSLRNRLRPFNRVPGELVGMKSIVTQRSRATHGRSRSSVNALVAFQLGRAAPNYRLKPSAAARAKGQRILAGYVGNASAIMGRNSIMFNRSGIAFGGFHLVLLPRNQRGLTVSIVDNSLHFVKDFSRFVPAATQNGVAAELVTQPSG